jgi:predicted transcriptional regulator
MFCPSCGYDNIEGVDRCEECMTPLLALDVPRPESTQGLARSVMEDNLALLEQEYLGITPDAPVAEVIEQMKQAHVGCALVLDGGRLVGIFTERDLLTKLAGKQAVQPASAVREFMSPDPEILRETDSIATALNKMSLGRYRHIPVLKADGSFCVTSIKHVLKYLAASKW